MRTKSDVLADLRVMLKDVLAAKAAGGSHQRIARAHGYVDGYMRALLDLEVVGKEELLDLVAFERERASGPALRVLDEETPAPTVRAIRRAATG
jgi:hypothetical protein